jgi:hypothetical protein
VNANEMLRIQDTVLILACSINDFSSEILCLVPNDFAEGIFYGRVVALYEVAVNELYCKGRFAERLPTTAILRCLGGDGMVRD